MRGTYVPLREAVDAVERTRNTWQPSAPRKQRQLGGTVDAAELWDMFNAAREDDDDDEVSISGDSMYDSDDSEEGASEPAVQAVPSPVQSPLRTTALRGPAPTAPQAPRVLAPRTEAAEPRAPSVPSIPTQRAILGAAPVAGLSLGIPKRPKSRVTPTPAREEAQPVLPTQLLRTLVGTPALPPGFARLGDEPAAEAEQTQLSGTGDALRDSWDSQLSVEHGSQSADSDDEVQRHGELQDIADLAGALQNILVDVSSLLPSREPATRQAPVLQSSQDVNTLAEQLREASAYCAAAAPSELALPSTPPEPVITPEEAALAERVRRREEEAERQRRALAAKQRYSSRQEQLDLWLRQEQELVRQVRARLRAIPQRSHRAVARRAAARNTASAPRSAERSPDRTRPSASSASSADPTSAGPARAANSEAEPSGALEPTGAAQRAVPRVAPSLAAAEAEAQAARLRAAAAFRAAELRRPVPTMRPTVPRGLTTTPSVPSTEQRGEEDGPRSPPTEDRRQPASFIPPRRAGATSLRVANMVASLPEHLRRPLATPELPRPTATGAIVAEIERRAIQARQEAAAAQHLDRTERAIATAAQIRAGFEARRRREPPSVRALLEQAHRRLGVDLARSGLLSASVDALATALERLPSVVLDEERLGERSIDCAVCLERVCKGERMTTLPCAHQYHTECIKQWLLKGAAACPQCRQKLV